MPPTPISTRPAIILATFASTASRTRTPRKRPGIMPRNTGINCMRHCPVFPPSSACGKLQKTKGMLSSMAADLPSMNSDSRGSATTAMPSPIVPFRRPATIKFQTTSGWRLVWSKQRVMARRAQACPWVSDALDDDDLQLPRAALLAVRRGLKVLGRFVAGDRLLEARELDNDEAVEFLRALE